MSLNFLQPKPTPTPAPAPPPPVASGIASESTVPEAVLSQAEPTTIPATTSPEVTQEMTTSSQSTSDSASSSLGDLLSGHNLQDAIDNIVEMGFPRDQVMRAMRASFNNADRAVEYLMAVSAFSTFSWCFLFDLLLFKGFPAHSEADVPSPAVSSAIQMPTPVETSTTNHPQNLFQVHPFSFPYLSSRSRYQSNSWRSNSNKPAFLVPGPSLILKHSVTTLRFSNSESK